MTEKQKPRRQNRINRFRPRPSIIPNKNNLTKSLTFIHNPTKSLVKCFLYYICIKLKFREFSITEKLIFVRKGDADEFL